MERDQQFWRASVRGDVYLYDPGRRVQAGKEDGTLEIILFLVSKQKPCFLAGFLVWCIYGLYLLEPLVKPCCWSRCYAVRCAGSHKRANRSFNSIIKAVISLLNGAFQNRGCVIILPDHLCCTESCETIPLNWAIMTKLIFSWIGNKNLLFKQQAGIINARIIEN